MVLRDWNSIPVYWEWKVDDSFDGGGEVHATVPLTALARSQVEELNGSLMQVRALGIE